MIASLASLAGGVLANTSDALDTIPVFWRSAVVSVQGALVMGVIVGDVTARTGTPGNPPALGVGLSTAMLTFCLVTPTAIAVFHPRGSRGMVRPALALVVIGLVAGPSGVAAGALIG